MAIEAIGAKEALGSSDNGSLVEVAREAVLQAILSRQYSGGDVLYESKLASSLGLSRTPVREALGRLEGEGLVTRRGRVLMVKHVSMNEYLEVLHLRRIIETEAAALACAHLAEDRLSAIRASVEAMQDPATVTPEQHWALDDEIHLSIAEASGNGQLARLVIDLRRKTRLFDLRRVPSRFGPGRLEHLAIIDALLRRDAEGAREAMRVHLENVKLGILGRLHDF